MSHLASYESIEHAAARFWDQPEEDFIPIDIVAAVLGVGRNSVKQLDLPSWVIAGFKCHKKGDVLDWLEKEHAQPTGVLRELQQRHEKQLRRRSPRPGSPEARARKAMVAAMRAAAQDELAAQRQSPVAVTMGSWFAALARNETPSTETVAAVTRIIEALERLEPQATAEWAMLWDLEQDVVGDEGLDAELFRVAGDDSLLARYLRAQRAHFAG